MFSLGEIWPQTSALGEVVTVDQLVNQRKAPRAEGTIASSFASLSDEEAVALPDRFADLKRWERSS
jgi:hypothetical protein